MLPEFSKELQSCHANQIWAKISQNYTKFNFLQEIEEFFSRAVRYMGLSNSNTLPEFPTEPRELPRQTKWGKKTNCTDFTSVQDMGTMLTCIVGFLGSANSKMLIKILREQKELPYQPNLHK